MANTNFYLIRHSESTDNASQNRFSGSADPGLTKHGKVQAFKSGEYLKRKLEKIYTSPKKRSIQTANILSSSRINIIENENLREIDFGVWEGLTKSEVKREYPQDYSDWNEDPFNNYPKDGEKPIEGLKRMKRAMNTILEDSQKQDFSEIGVVSHKCIIRIFLSYIMDKKLSKYRDIDMDNCSINKLSYEIGEWKVRYLNKVVY